MSGQLSKNTRFLNEIKNFYRDNRDEIVDIILFGSVLKGKENPADIDILVVYKKKDNLDLNHSLKKKLNSLKLNVEITSKTYKGLFESAFKIKESFLSEGYSLVNHIFISEGLGFSNWLLLKYELAKKSKSDRMRFYYSLYGRNGGKGMLDKLKAIKFSDGIILCPMESTGEMKDYLQEWNISFLEFPVLIPTRIMESELLKNKN